MWQEAVSMKYLDYIWPTGANSMDTKRRYDYLRQLPLHLSTLREVAYEMFLPSANEFLQQHCLEARCHALK